MGKNESNEQQRRDENQSTLNIDGRRITQIKEFAYLESIIISDAIKNEQETKNALL